MSRQAWPPELPFPKLYAPREDQLGTKVQYEQYQQLISAYAKTSDQETWFDSRTPVAVQQALEKARTAGLLVRIFCGDTSTGESWLEEYDTIGKVHRSTGPLRSPLLVAPNQDGGPALLSHCIVRIVDIARGADMYRHPSFHTPSLRVTSALPQLQEQGYTHCVQARSSEPHNKGQFVTLANFKGLQRASDWLSFISGDTHKAPPH